MDKNCIEKLKSCAGWNIRKLARLMAQVYDNAYSPVGLKNTQFTTLAIIAAAEPISINTLAELVGADRTTLTRNLALLEKQSLIKIVKNQHDTRAKNVTITHRGKALFESAYPLWEQTQTRIESILGEEDWQLFSALLDKIHAGTSKMID